MAQIRSKPFGVTKQGANVTEYILSNPGGLTVSVLDYGCIIKNIIVPAKNGPVDVVLGHDTMADYEDDFTSSGSTCCGAFVGRYANRIENATFSVGGKTYQLEANNGPNHLHGCFSRKLYRVKAFGDTLLMEAESPDGEDGFPGNLKLAVRYTLTEDNTFRMDYRVSSDADTIVNLTNHSYFNLNGAFIVNTARGDLVASAALAKALCSGKIAGAGLDTIAPEPVTTENPLLSLPHDRRGDPGGAKRTAAGKYRERVIIKSKTKTPLQLKWKSCEGVFACTATAHMGGCYCLLLAGGSGFMASSAVPSSFG